MVLTKPSQENDKHTSTYLWSCVGCWKKPVWKDVRLPQVHIHNVMWALFGRKGSRDNLREFILLCCLLDDNFLSILCFIVIVTKPSPLAKINFAVAFSDSSTNLRSQSSEIQRWHSSHNLKWVSLWDPVDKPK